MTQTEIATVTGEKANHRGTKSNGRNGQELADSSPRDSKVGDFKNTTGDEARSRVNFFGE